MDVKRSMASSDLPAVNKDSAFSIGLGADWALSETCVCDKPGWISAKRIRRVLVSSTLINDLLPERPVRVALCGHPVKPMQIDAVRVAGGHGGPPVQVEI